MQDSPQNENRDPELSYYYEDVKCECCGEVVTVGCSNCDMIMDWRCFDNHECEKKKK